MSSYLRNYRRIMCLGFPIFIGQLGMIVVGFADNSMVGHYDTNALAASSFVVNIFNIAVLMCMGFTYGLTPLIGALYAKRANDEIGFTLRFGLRLNVIFALAVTAIMALLYLNLSRLGQPSDLLPLIRPYFLLYLAGILPITIFQVFSQWSYAINSTRMPMWISILANVINVCGNYLLIFGHLGCPELGLFGAGLSTLISRIVPPVVIFVVFLRGKRYRCYHAGFFSHSRRPGLLRHIFHTSWPVSLQMGLETGSFSVAAVMAGWLGTVQLASYQILVIIGCLGFCIYYSVSAAVSVLVANAAGSDDRREMRRVAFAGYHVTLLLALCSSTVFYLFGAPLISVFTDDAAVQQMSVSLLIPLILYQLMDATQINFAGALRGTANVLPMLYSAFLAYLVIGIPASYLLAFPLGLGLPGIFLSFSISLLAAALLFLCFFLRTTRR